MAKKKKKKKADAVEFNILTEFSFRGDNKITDETENNTFGKILFRSVINFG